MSQKVIYDLVLPIVLKILRGMGEDPTNAGRYAVQDKQLVDYLEEELIRRFRIIGRVGACDKLEEMIREALDRNPYEFERLIERLLNTYIDLRLMTMVPHIPNPYFNTRRKPKEEVKIV